MSDQRRFTRIEHQAEATLTWNGHSFPAKLLDICLKGLLLESVEEHETLEGELSVAVYFDGIEEHIEARVHCCHQEGRRIGLEFDALDLESASLLKRLIEMNLGSEEQMQREVSALIAAYSPPQT